MSNNYAPCFNRIDFAVIPSYIERPFLDFMLLSERLCILNWVIFSFTKIIFPKSMCIIRNTWKYDYESCLRKSFHGYKCSVKEFLEIYLFILKNCKLL